MDLDLKEKRIAIQGSSTGIGLAIAQAFSKEGASISMCSRNLEKIRIAAKPLPGAHYFAIDLDSPGSGKEFIRQTVKNLGGIDVLITNTGGPPKGMFLDVQEADWERGFKRTWMSAVESIQEALPHMKSQGFGRIILSTSTSAKEPISGLTVSSALRAGLLGLMKSMSQEVAARGVTVNAILPGYTQTERLAELNIPIEEWIRDIPLGRLGNPEEVAALALFLASKPAAYITGQAIACDGGLLRGL